MKKILLNLIISIPLFADITYLNEIRENSGLNNFSTNTNLTKSAKNHVAYLYQNNLHISHEQTIPNFFSGRCILKELYILDMEQVMFLKIYLKEQRQIKNQLIC